MNSEIITKCLLTSTNWVSSHDIWVCSMAQTTPSSFMESHVVRAILKLGKLLNLGKAETVAHVACDRYLLFQGVQEKDVFDMNYGYDVDEHGKVNCSCIADAASVAASIVQTVMAYPDYPKNAEYLDAVKRYIDHTLENYVTEEGYIGVGILGHEINPMKMYWCANSLFTEVLVLYAIATGEEKYFDAAVAPCEYIARLDYKNLNWNEWQSSPTEVVLYSCTGIVRALMTPEMQERLKKTKPQEVFVDETVKAEDEFAIAEAGNKIIGSEVEKEYDNTGKSVYDLLSQRFDEYFTWLYKNQEINGIYTPPHTKNARSYEMGISWMLGTAYMGGVAGERAKVLIDRQITAMCSDYGKLYFSIYANDWTSALVLLSAATAAEILMQENPEEFKKTLQDGMAKIYDFLW